MSDVVLVEGADRVEQVQRQPRRVLHRMPVLVHVDVVAACPDAAFVRMPSRPAAMMHGLQQIGIGGAVRQAQLEAALARHANHVRAVVAGPGDGVGRPGRARDRARRVDALVGVDRRVGDRGERLGMLHDAAEEVDSPAATGPSHPLPSKNMFVLPSLSQTEMWAWQPLPVRPGKGFGMNVARRPCFSAIDLTMNLKNECRSAVTQRVVEVPVHLELAVGVLVVVLVGPPAELEHVVADLGDDVVAAHQGLLVVAGLAALSLSSEIAVPSGVDQEELAFDAGLDVKAQSRRLRP